MYKKEAKSLNFKAFESHQTLWLTESSMLQNCLHFIY